MRHAIVHDYLTDIGGAERVADALVSIFPESILYTSVYNPEACFPAFHGHDVRATFVDHVVKKKSGAKALFPLMPYAFRSLGLDGFDLVLSSSSGFAHHVRPSTDALHICYCHNPPRFLWQPDEYFMLQPHLKTVLRPALAALRRLDLTAARKVDAYVANSATVAKRILATYGRRAEVIHPPVDVRRHRLSRERSGRFLIVSRLLPYKRIDLAIEAANRAGLDLDIIGSGSDRARLEAMAGETVRFLGRRSDGFVRHSMARCTALVIPGMEDFGLTAVEAQASGRPVVAFGAGGALETVIDGSSGFLFTEQTWEELARTMIRARDEPLPGPRLHAAAERFDVSVFERRLKAFIEREVEKRLPGLLAHELFRDAPVFSINGSRQNGGAAVSKGSRSLRSVRRP